MGCQELRKLGVLRSDRAADLVAEPRDTRIGDPVDRPRPVLGSADDPLAVKQRQMLGDVRVTPAESLRDLADRERLFTAQDIKNPDAVGFGERREPRGDERGQILRDRRIGIEQAENISN